MDDERTYDEDEVAQLLDRAAAQAARRERVDDAAPPVLGSGGLTLAQVHEIAATVGIPADAVTRAAASVARGDLVPTARRTSFGIPVGVSRQVELPRQMTDVEFDRLVVRLRETFGAEGRVTREGTIRTWRNGNLRVALEPTAQGSRVRMSTVRGDASVQTQIGVGVLSLSAVLTGLLTLSPGAIHTSWGSVVVLAAAGIGLLARNVLTLPRWARARAQQMEQLSEVVAEIVDGKD